MPRIIFILPLFMCFPVLVWAGDLNLELIEAAKRGDSSRVQSLLNAGAEVNSKNIYGMVC